MYVIERWKVLGVVLSIRTGVIVFMRGFFVVSGAFGLLGLYVVVGWWSDTVFTLVSRVRFRRSGLEIFLWGFLKINNLGSCYRVSFVIYSYFSDVRYCDNNVF